MILLRCAFLLNDQTLPTQEEKKKSEINHKDLSSSPNLDLAIQNKVETNSKMPLKDQIDLNQSFFQFYGKNFSPLMAGIILENCEIISFSENEKKLILHAIDEKFPGSEELKQNLDSEFSIDILIKKNINTLESLKSLYKQELISKEMQTDNFKKVLAKFPNAKIIDIEEVERGDENDG